MVEPEVLEEVLEELLVDRAPWVVSPLSDVVVVGPCVVGEVSLAVVPDADAEPVPEPELDVGLVSVVFPVEDSPGLVAPWLALPFSESAPTNPPQPVAKPSSITHAPLRPQSKITPRE